MVHPFDQLPGVISVTSGYTGGSKAKPTYEQVSSGTTGHAEAVDVVYDPAKIGYEKLLDVFWHNVDPFAKNYQFCDHGTQYRSAIFVHDETQKRLAEASKAEIQKRFKQPIETEIDAGFDLLAGRGVPPGLLQEEPAQLPVLPRELRARPPARGDLGQERRVGARGLPSSTLSDWPCRSEPPARTLTPGPSPFPSHPPSQGEGNPRPSYSRLFSLPLLFSLFSR